jgi:hypothetical protein
MIIHLDREEPRAPTPIKVPPCVLVSTGSIHRKLEKVKFTEFFGTTDGTTVEAWLENMVILFSLHNYTSNMKVYMVAFQLNGSALVWWKTLLPQLNMVVEDV